MIIDFKYGFEYDGFLFGWHKKELYRLPSLLQGKSYCVKKLKLINVGNQKGYRIKQRRISLNRLIEMTLPLENAIKIAQNKHIPLL